MENRLIKPIALILAGFLVVFFGWQAVQYYRHRGLTAVKVTVLPSDSSLKIDGKAVKPGKLYLTAGTHKFVASRALFEDDTKTISTSDIAKNETIYMLPKAVSGAAKVYLLQHPDIQQQREAAGGAESDRIRALVLKKYPIIAKLPQETLRYKIDYSLDSNQKLSLTITTYGIINRPSDYPQYLQQTKDYRAEALDFLKHNNISPNTYPISYVPNI
jgi:hypothetical protein